MVITGTLALPAGSIGEPFVDLDDLADVAVAALTEDGRNAHLADGVTRALGRQPKDFSTFAREVAATGTWRNVA